ncbi:hypothetical protein WJX79_004719 [Trebouxia sp. C0005]
MLLQALHVKLLDNGPQSVPLSPRQHWSAIDVTNQQERGGFAARFRDHNLVGGSQGAAVRGLVWETLRGSTRVLLQISTAQGTLVVTARLDTAGEKPRCGA